MIVAVLVNSWAKEKPEYSTTRLVHSLLKRGHRCFVMQADSLWMDEKNNLNAMAKEATSTDTEDLELSLKQLVQGYIDKPEEIVNLYALDMILLRNDPAEERESRYWAQEVGIYFGRIAASNGVLVVNSPKGLQRAINKSYLQTFPEKVRPRSVITRRRDLIEGFLNEVGQIVLKPIQGSSGQGVFLLSQDNMSNFDVFITTLKKKDYIIAQEYLPQVEEGDIRLFMLNGRPLKYKGKYAMYRRLSPANDFRSNVSVGATTEYAKMNDDIRELAEIVGPKLKDDGIFLAAIDIVGNKILEFNVFSPGGLGNAQKFQGVNFSDCVIEELEILANNCPENFAA